MIPTILRVFWIELRRDRVVWLLTFLVPVAFFSIFSMIFSGQSRDKTPKVRVAVVDEDHSSFSKKLLRALDEESSLRVTKQQEENTLTRKQAETLVREGKVAAAIILPKGLGKSFPSFSSERPTVEVLADTSDPVAPQMLGGLLQGLVMTAAPESMMQGGIDQLKQWGGKLTPQQEKAIAAAEKFFQQNGKNDNPKAQTSATGLLAVQVVDVLGQTKANPIVAFFAAATAVMFLLFTCAHGAGGSLIEEVENGTLDRLLSSKLTMTELLLGKWVSFVLLGMMQVSVMFVWGWLMFQLELWSHLPGFLVMTLATSAAAAAFGLVLGTICRSRGQLTGIATTLILLMSALGGSMIPRFVMSETLQNIGLITFNAWALDGYQKVFWRDAPVGELWPQVVVLVSLTGVFLVVARLLARRWEIA